MSSKKKIFYPYRIKPVHTASIIFFCCILLSVFLLAGCNTSGGHSETPVASHKSVSPSDTSANTSADTAIGYNPIPVLCYHQIRDWVPSDSKNGKVYILPVQQFREQIKILQDSGYHAVLPDELVCYMQHKCKVPKRPILLTFDDGTEGQYTTALPELDKAGFKATFFIITVTINHDKYLTSAQIKDLLARGHEIGCHTWDHHRVDKYNEKDWEKQLTKPLASLQSITGKPIKYFAYPFGLWNEAAIDQLKKHDITAAFRLWDKREPSDSMLALKRILISGYWNGNDLIKAIHRAGY